MQHTKDTVQTVIRPSHLIHQIQFIGCIVFFGGLTVLAVFASLVAMTVWAVLAVLVVLTVLAALPY